VLEGEFVDRRELWFFLGRGGFVCQWGGGAAGRGGPAPANGGDRDERDRSRWKG